MSRSQHIEGRSMRVLSEWLSASRKNQKCSHGVWTTWTWRICARIISNSRLGALHGFNTTRNLISVMTSGMKFMSASAILSIEFLYSRWPFLRISKTCLESLFLSWLMYWHKRPRYPTRSSTSDTGMANTLSDCSAQLKMIVRLFLTESLTA